jgi:hypothetical protein
MSKQIQNLEQDIWLLSGEVDQAIRNATLLIQKLNELNSRLNDLINEVAVVADKEIDNA